MAKIFCHILTAYMHLVVGLPLSDTSHLILHFDEATSIYAEAVETIVDSPDVYSFDGVSSVIEHGNFSNYKLKSEKGDYSTFNTGIALSNHSYVLRTYDTLLKQNILIKSASGRPDIRAPGLLKKQIDGIFCTDGMLVYQGKSTRLFYTYFYRNQFLCMDTGLNLLYQGKTIDTVSKAHLTVAYIASQKKYTLSSPPLIVSKSCCVDGNYYYVYSKLRADNEEQHPEFGYSAIDVYELLNGRYLYSFFIPNDDRTPMNNFKVKGQHLVAMYDHTIMTFLIHVPGSN